MPLPRNKAWFAAGKSGASKGWTKPLRWQGWLVIGLYLLALLAVPLFPALRQPLLLGTHVILCTLILVAVLFWKGEKLS